MIVSLCMVLSPKVNNQTQLIPSPSSKPKTFTSPEQTSLSFSCNHLFWIYLNLSEDYMKEPQAGLQLSSAMKLDPYGILVFISLGLTETIQKWNSII